MTLIPNILRTGAWETSLALLDRFPVRRRSTLPDHLLVGRAGEEAAFFFLRRVGFTVVAHGWQSGKAPGDIDLIAWEGDTLCFVEVKTRSSRGFATAESAVDRGKRHSLRRLARHYLRQVTNGTPTRFDVLSIYLKAGEPARRAEFELFRNAFQWEESPERN